MELFIAAATNNKTVQTETKSSPGLWVVSQDVEKGVDAGFELPGSENVREMRNVAFPPGREKNTVLIRGEEKKTSTHSRGRCAPSNEELRGEGDGRGFIYRR